MTSAALGFFAMLLDSRTWGGLRAYKSRKTATNLRGLSSENKFVRWRETDVRSHGKRCTLEPGKNQRFVHSVKTCGMCNQQVNK